MAVGQIREATKKKVMELGIKEDEIDLSYITEELVAKSANARRKDALPKSSAGFTGQPNYYGNQLAHVSGSVWSWTNGNSSSGSDLPAHKCGSGYRWQANFSAYNTGAGWACPENNPPGGFQAWA